MNNSIKRVTKKALSVLLAVAMLVSMLSVAFTAFADAAVYTVVNNKPVIPAKQGTVIDLTKIDVQFGGDTYNGANITWSTTDTSGGVRVDDTAKTVDVAGSDIYAIEATANGETKTIYIIEPAANGSAVIYDYTFSADDLKTIEPLVIDGVNYTPSTNPNDETSSSLSAHKSTHVAGNPASDWALFNTAHAKYYGKTYTTADGVEFTYTNPDWITQQNSWTYTDGKGLGIATNAAAYMYLKPETKGGKLVSAFADYTIDFTYSGRYAATSNSRYFYLLGKYSLINATYNGTSNNFVLKDEKFAGVQLPGGNNFTYTSFSTVVSGGEGTVISDKTFATATADNNVRVTFNGNNITYAIKLATQSEYTVLYDGVAREGEDIANLKGTIAIDNAEQSRQYNKSITVTIDLTAEAAVMDAYLSDLLIVEASKPAIPLTAGKKLDLSSIYFEFDNGAVARGADITWSTEETGVAVDNTAKTVTMFAPGIYKITAAYAKADAPKTIYIIEPNSDGTKELYYHAFSESEVDTATGDFVADSAWTLTSGAGNLAWNSIGGVQTGNALYCGYQLKPESEAGKLVSSFRDVIIDANIAFSTNFGAADKTFDFSLVGRVNGSTYAGGGFNGAGGQTVDWARLNVSGTENLYTYDTKNTTTNTFYSYRVSLIGNDIKIAKNGVEAPITLSDDQLAKIGDTKTGTISLSDYNTRLVFKDIKVTLVFTADELSAYDHLISDIVLVSADSPAIPMAAKTTADLSNIYFGFDSGLVASGKDITWSTADTSGAVAVEGTTVLLTASGIYTITAEYKGEKKDFYVLEPDADNTKVIYSHTFSENDLVDGQFTEESEWTHTDASALGTSYNGVTGIGNYGNISDYFYLRPDSESGKLVSQFSNVIVEVNYALPSNFNWSGNEIAGPLARVNFVNNTVADGRESYVIVTYTRTNNEGSNQYNQYTDISYSVNGVGGPSTDLGLTIPQKAFSTVKVELIGNSMRTFINTGAGFVETTQDLTADQQEALNNTKGGTIGIFSGQNYRAPLGYAKVSIAFAEDLVKAIKDASSELFVVSNTKPAIPMTVGKKINISDIYFQFPSGKVALGKNITWSTTDETGGLIVEDTEKTIALLSNSILPLTATLGDDVATFYVLEPDSSNEYVLMNYTFSADDVLTGIPADTPTYFGKDDTWIAYSASASSFAFDASKGLSLSAANTNSYALLNPESPYGQLVSSFADYTIESSASNWTPNWNERSDSTFTYYLRYNMAGEKINTANDTYLGFAGCFCSTAYGYAEYSNNGKLSAGSGFGYDPAINAIDTKVKVEGSNLTAWQKNKGASEYTKVYEMNEDTKSDASKLAAARGVTGAGTVGWYSYNIGRAYMQYIKVSISFTEEEIAKFSNPAITTDLVIVPASKPAIPMTIGKKVNVSDIFFAFDSGAVALGKNITWSTTDTTGGVMVADADKAIALLGSDIYTVTAEFNGEEKIFYVLEPDSNNQREIYYHAFSEADVDTSTKNFVADSDWTLVSGAGDLAWNSIGGVQTGGALYCGYVLKPSSDAGKLVSSFRDVIIDANIAFSTSFGAADKSYDFSLVGRMNWENNETLTGATTYAGGGFNGMGGQSVDWARLNVSGTENLYTYDTKNTAVNTFYSYRVSLIGDNIEIYKNGAKAPITLNDTQVSKIGDTKAGTLSLSDYNTRLVFKDIKVTIQFTDEEIATFSKPEINSDLTIVKSGNPVIPMEAGTKISVSDIFFEFNSGKVFSGASIEWSSNNNSVVVDNDTDTITLFAAGRYDITASFGGEEKTLYVITPDENNQHVLMNYIFSSSDTKSGIAAGTPTYFGENDTWIAYNESGNASIAYDSSKGISLSAGNTNTYALLNPDSAYGKLVSNFADYTIETQATSLQLSWGDRYDTYYNIYGRYNVKGSVLSNKNDTYLGIQGLFYSSSNSSIIYSGGNAYAGASSFGYNPSTFSVNTKMTFKGNDLTVWQKNRDDANYTKVYQLSEDTTSDPSKVAAARAVTGAGTVGWYSYNIGRAYIKYFKVTIDIDTDLFAKLKATAENISVIPANNPALPMSVNTVLNLKELYFEFDGGKAVQGKNITWSYEGEKGGVVVSDNDKTITLFTADYLYPITATAGDYTATFYVYALEKDTKIEIYNKEFSSEDFEYNGYGEYFFTKDSEWMSDAVYDESRPSYSNVRWSESHKAIVAMYTEDLANAEGFWLGDWGAGTIFLDPNSESGKLVTSFRDIIVEADAVSTTTYGSSGRGSVGPIARLQINPIDYMDLDGDGELAFESNGDPEIFDWYGDNEWQYDGYDTPWSGKYGYNYDYDTGAYEEIRTIPVNRVASLWRIQGGGDNTAFTLDISTKNLEYVRPDDGMTVPTVPQNFKFYNPSNNNNKPAVSTQTLSVIGNTVTATLQGKEPAGELNTAVFTLTDAQNAALTETDAGTIGFHIDNQCRGGVRAIRAYITPTEAQKALVEKNSTKLQGVYTMKYSAPAMPMEVNYKLDLTNIYFELNENGILGKGSDLTFSVNNSLASVDNVTKTVTMLGEGVATLTVSNGDLSADYYLVTADENGEYVIYDHTFSGLDLSGGAFTEESEWATTFSSSLTINAHGIYGNAASAAAFYLREDSASGKMISRFADITTEFTGVVNGVVGRLFGSILRVDLGDNDAYDSTDSGLFFGVFPYASNSAAPNNASWMRLFYSGVRQDSDRHIMLKDQNGNDFIINNEGQTYTYRTTVNGANAAVSFKTVSHADPTDVRTSYKDLSGYPIPKALQKGGTAGFYTDSDARNINVSNFKAIITIDETLKQNIKNNSVKVNIIDSTKPAIPMNVGQTLDLKLLTLTADNGVLIDGATATWSLSDENAYVVLDTVDRAVIAYSSGYATLTATDSLGNSVNIYITIADSKGEYTIYYHKFSLNDLEIAADGNYVFTDASEWYGKSLSSGYADSEIKLGFNKSISADGYVMRGMTATNGNSTGWAMYVRPDSASGIKLSKFSDITLNTYLIPQANNANFYYNYTRLKINEDGTIGNNFNQMVRVGNSGAPATWVRVNKNNNSNGYIREIRNITTPAGENFAPTQFQGWYATYTVSGAENGSITYASKADYSDAITITHSPSGANISTADGASKDVAYDINRVDDSLISEGGTIGFGGGALAMISYDFVEVQITFTDAELAYYDQFKADNNSVKVQEFEDISKYRGEPYTAPDAPYGKVFAGWYTDANCTETLDPSVKSGKAYAKFVSNEVFSVKWQITDPADTFERVVNGKQRKDNSFDLRLVSTVDTTKYNRVGFTLERSDGKVAGFTTDTVYKKITGEQGTVVYDPTSFADISKYFITVNVTNFDWATWGNEFFTATTVFETKDGTIVYNTSNANTFKPSNDTQAIDLAEAEMYEKIKNNPDTLTANKVYYVSNSGADSYYAGTKSSPYKTLNYAMSKAKTYKDNNPSKTVAILLKRGDTFRESVLMGKDISIGAYGTGAKPKVYGSWDALTDSRISAQKIDYFQIDANDTKQAGLRLDKFTAPEGTELWSINLTNSELWGATKLDFGSIFFVEDEAEQNVIAADKKWFKAEENYRYDASLDDMVEAYDFFFDYNNKMVYVLLPEGKNLTDFAHVEIQNSGAVLYAQPNTGNSFDCDDSMSNISFQNLEIRYGNFGISVSEAHVDASNTTNPFTGHQNFKADGLEIGWIGGARQGDEGVYNSSAHGSYTRLGNGIEIWGGCENMVVENCYIYQVYDAAVTFQFNVRRNNGGYEDITTDYILYKDINISNNLLTDNVYNFEYFMSVDMEDSATIETYDYAKMQNISFSDNICRRAGGTADNEMWGLAYRPDKGVASHIKGGNTYGNHTILDENGDSTFVIENNIFDSAVNSALGVSASNEGGEPEFRNNIYVVANNEKFTVNNKSYEGKQFIKLFDKTGSLVTKATAGSVYASARTLSTWGGVEEIDNLANTNYKLKNGENINVGYLGGSVTAGTGADDASTQSWRALTTAYLTEKAAATGSLITETNAAWGGTGSSWGFFRMNEQLLKNDLDLVFVEFSINDVYAGLSKTQSALYMEGIIKKLREVNPYMDIVIVFITDEGHIGGADWDNKAAHKAVAEHYGIPTIDVGAALAKDMAETGKQWSDYSEDIVHPNADAYEIYAIEVAQSLDVLLTAEAPAGLVKHEVPTTDLVSNQATLTEIVTVDRIANVNGFEVRDNTFTTFVEEEFFGSAGSSFTYTFTGNSLGLFLSNLENAPGTVTFKATIDGKETVEKTFKGGDCRELPLVENLKNGTHTVKVEVVSGGEIAIGGILIAK